MTNSGKHTSDQASNAAGCDTGFTLIEILIVVAILGVLGSVLVLSLTGMSTFASDVGCKADRYLVQTTVEAYFAQTGGDAIPATGTDHDRFEQTLVDGGFLRSVSTMHDLDASGNVVPQENSSC